MAPRSGTVRPATSLPVARSRDAVRRTRDTGRAHASPASLRSPRSGSLSFSWLAQMAVG